jgi:DNA modification methylase
MKFKIEYKKTDALIPYAQNARTHSENQVSQIATSIEKFGFVNPVLIRSDFTIIAGHGRVLAAKQLKLKEVPTIVLDHLSEREAKALVLADNKLAMNSGWDFEKLSNEISALAELDFDISIIGFDEQELDALLKDAADILPSGSLEPEKIQVAGYERSASREGLTDDDDVPDAPVSVVSQRGDIWMLGDHRLMCGDSTSQDDVSVLMDGEKADMVFTDPPYGISFKPQRGTHDAILNDSLKDSDFAEFLGTTFLLIKEFTKADSYLFVWTGWPKIGLFEKTLSELFKIQSMHIWVKNNFGIGYYSRPKHEPFYLCLHGKPKYPIVPPADVWEFPKVHKTIHSCEKPVGLIENILNTYNDGGIVIDAFGGSGSTLVACEKTNRKARLMELDPKYVDVIVKRWKNFTGKQAVHSSGKTFEQIAQERG